MQRKPKLPSPAEDRAIRAGIAADPDTHELTREEIKSLKPHRFGGRPKLANPKLAIKLRIDADIVQFFRSNGAGWQTRLNAALVEHVARARRKRP